MMWWLVTLAACVCADYWTNEDEPKNNTGGWVDSLRRRLMRDNYDYQEPSAELALVAGALDSTTPDNNYDLERETTADANEDPLLYTTINSLYLTQSPADIPRNEEVHEMDGNYISRNDLYSERGLLPVAPQFEVTGVQEGPPKNVTYRVLKLAQGSRRQGSAPRFVEELAPDGVVLLSVDGAPFPQFRLPAPRRQYQPGDASSQD